MIKKYMPKSHFLRKNKLMNSYLFIGQFHKYNIELRGVVIKALKEKYDQIKKNSSIPIDQKIVVLAELELEVMCKVMELSEILASICYALTKNNKNIKENFIDFNSFRGGNPDKLYDLIWKENISYYYNLLTYPQINNLDLTFNEKQLIKKSYSLNIKALKIMFKGIYEFRKLNKIAYNKARHSKPMLMGLPAKTKYSYGVTAVYSRKKRTKKIGTYLFFNNELFFNKYIDLSIMIMHLCKDLLWNRIMFFECKGKNPLLLVTYFETTEEEKSILKSISDKYNLDTTRDNIKLTLELKMNVKVLKKRFNLINVKLKSFKYSSDKYFKKYVNQLKN